MSCGHDKTKVNTFEHGYDLVILKKHLDAEIQKNSNILAEETNFTAWRSLAEATLARIVLLNKRRGAEAAKLLITAYQNRPNWTATANHEVLCSLTDLEKKMFQRWAFIGLKGNIKYLNF